MIHGKMWKHMMRTVRQQKQLLAEAGYEDGKGFPALTYIVNNDSRKEIAEAIVNDWKEVLGIDSITVEKVENFSAARNAGDYDLAYLWMVYGLQGSVKYV